jgi:hypothetical protein
MTKIPFGKLHHGPWDDDPAWFPGKEDSPESREEIPAMNDQDSEDSSRSSVRPDMSKGLSGCSRCEQSICPRTVLPPMRILQSAYAAIMRHLTGVEPEAGGMLLGPKGSSLVTHYVPDENGRATAASFTLDAVGLNRILKMFLACETEGKGIVHSHPIGCTTPSLGDLLYVRRSFGNPKNKDLSEFLLPIVCGGQMFPYIVAGDPLTVRAAELILI